MLNQRRQPLSQSGEIHVLFHDISRTIEIVLEALLLDAKGMIEDSLVQ
jgi:hypothetical protein